MVFAPPKKRRKKAPRNSYLPRAWREEVPREGEVFEAWVIYSRDPTTVFRDSTFLVGPSLSEGNFPIGPESFSNARMLVRFRILQPNRVMEFAEIEDWLRERGCRPATPIELISLAEQNSRLGRSGPVHATGKSWRWGGGIVALYVSIGKRYLRKCLNLYYFGKLPGDCLVLGVIDS